MPNAEPRSMPVFEPPQRLITVRLSCQFDHLLGVNGRSVSGIDLGNKIDVDIDRHRSRFWLARHGRQKIGRPRNSQLPHTDGEPPGPLSRSAAPALIGGRN
ncbi:unnamed protein product [Soboliphyme baturini]|uniref:S4 RNA-binding domain-containing protein n=1 Tax=Soboliphyme baturini TaxID=241478 RepID=A0A183IWD3_9BILA|nr:unnamed protein product [Soboliphyme baturini]